MHRCWSHHQREAPVVIRVKVNLPLRRQKVLAPTRHASA